MLLIVDLALLVDARVSGNSCSELGCIELFLLPLVGAPLALLLGSLAIAMVPSRIRARTALWALASLVLLMVAFVAPLAGALR